MKSRAFGLTDIGKRRDSNEDNFVVDTPTGLFAVADGMGGHAAGEVAAQLAIDTLSDAFIGEDRPATDLDSNGAGEHLSEAVLRANRRIFESVVSRQEYRGMGTTVVSVVLSGNEYVVGHVGDSRAYLLRDETIERLTSDHSYVNEQVKLGLLTEEDADRHPMRNIVTRALGNRLDITVDLRRETPQPGDVVLLCSDGLNSMLSDLEIRKNLELHRDDPESACRALVEAANARGGEDNVTVIVIRFDDKES